MRFLTRKSNLAKQKALVKKEGPPKALPWTELEEDGALYNTLLKKVRYRSHTSEENLHDDVAFKEWETVKVKQLKAATLEKLVEHLTSCTSETMDWDPGFLMAFLCTYKSFATTDEVVNLLLERFRLCEKKLNSNLMEKDEALGIMKQVCSVLSVWIDQYLSDFDEPPTYNALTNIIKFMEERSHILFTKDVLQRYESKHTNLKVSPFADEKPFKFKFCSCPTVIGCTCEKKQQPGKQLDFQSFSPEGIAKQLTVVDAELFFRVIPRESLACFWSKRDVSKGSKAPSIKMTVDQFNAVSLKVVSTILNAVDAKSKQKSTFARSKAITKWIAVALDLRNLKNFSSLKAILSGLQSTPIYRLNRTWELVPKSSIAIYDDLAEIFSDEMNSKASRDLLIQEGTAKYSTSSLGKAKSKRQSLMREGVTHGTVPYLGTFLTDLMMIDTAFKDRTKEDLINFEKRRKEFEVIIQIKLLQQASKNYKIPPQEDFFIWFNSLETYSDKESYEKSLEVEPTPTKTLTPEPSRKPLAALRRFPSANDILQQKATDGFDTLNRAFSAMALNTLFNHKVEPDHRSHISPIKNNLKVESLSSRNTLDPNDSVDLDKSGVVVRVYLEDARNIQYKSIKILPSHRASDIIATTLKKFKCNEELNDFSLYQVIDNKKILHIPLYSNMYYAISKSDELIFKVSRKMLTKKEREQRDTLLKSPTGSYGRNSVPRISFDMTYKKKRHSADDMGTDPENYPNNNGTISLRSYGSLNK